MKPLKVLITNHMLDKRAGTELYVRDIATALLRRGHAPVVYSSRLGAVAREIRAATVPVVDDLDALAHPPDIIHGQHNLETMTALLRFPAVPAVFFCHGWLPWQEAPPRFPRILRYVAVDETCRDRLLCEYAIPADRVRLLLNFVDLERFKPRGPLPARPQRALVFSNGAHEETYLGAVRAACARAGIALDVIGRRSGNASARPEQLLGQYDLVFAKARCALEAMACGAAVVLCDEAGMGPLVTTDEFDRLRRQNFGIRTLQERTHTDALAREIARYDPHDASEVSRRVRATAGREEIVDEIIALYEEVLAEFADAHADGRAARANGRFAPADEAQAAAAYLRWLSIQLRREAEVVHSYTSVRLARFLLRVPLVRTLMVWKNRKQ